MNDEEFKSAVNRYQVEIKAYKVRSESAFVNLEKAREPYDVFFEDLLTYYLFASMLADKKILDDRPEYEWPLITLYAKATSDLLGILLSFRGGCLVGGTAICRTLFEVFVRVKFILQEDAKERLRLHANYHHVTRWLRLKYNPAAKKDNKVKAEIETAYDKVKGDYHPKKPYSWAYALFPERIKENRNPTLRDIAGRVGLLDEYDNMYGLLSIPVHANPLVGNQLVISEDVIGVAPRYSPSMYSIGLLGVFYLKEIIDTVVEYIKCQDWEGIQAFNLYYLADRLGKYKFQV
ncbi:MAG: hypothetical protein JW944_08610 [Deltaproteobacteria bacterium]|nr:hypothetical protein [Deltaproteobacteria bacterium]